MKPTMKCINTPALLKARWQCFCMHLSCEPHHQTANTPKLIQYSIVTFAGQWFQSGCRRAGPQKMARCQTLFHLKYAEMPKEPNNTTGVAAPPRLKAPFHATRLEKSWRLSPQRCTAAARRSTRFWALPWANNSPQPDLGSPHKKLRW